MYWVTCQHEQPESQRNNPSACFNTFSILFLRLVSKLGNSIIHGLNLKPRFSVEATIFLNSEEKIKRKINLKRV